MPTVEREQSLFTGIPEDSAELNDAVILNEPTESKKEYIKEDNTHIAKKLKDETIGIKHNGSTYGWTFSTGRKELENGNDNNELNIFFMGTSCVPLFTLNNANSSETGHVLSQAALQKNEQGKSAIIVKGIASVEMDDHFIQKSIENPNIQTGGSNYELVTGIGANERVELVMTEYLIPNLLTMLVKKPLKERDEITVNISGHSRGAITSYIMADCISQFLDLLTNGKNGEEFDVNKMAEVFHLKPEALNGVIADLKSNQDKVKLKICALDPVEGSRSMGQWSYNYFKADAYKPIIPVDLKKIGIKNKVNTSYSALPKCVSEALVLLAQDERRNPFRPTIPSLANEKDSKIICKQMYGKHGSMTGCFNDDAERGQFAYKTTIDDVKMQNNVIGIFDEAITLINKFIGEEKQLPPLPRNVLRRISNQLEYKETKELLVHQLELGCKDIAFAEFILGKNISINGFDIKEKIADVPDTTLIEWFEHSMKHTPNMNIMIYNSLESQAKKRLVECKEKTRSLRDEWRKDSNLGFLDRDSGIKERKVYIRGKKQNGYEKWQLVKLKELVRSEIQDEIYASNDQFHLSIRDAQITQEEFNVNHNLFISKIQKMANERVVYKHKVEREIVNYLGVIAKLGKSYNKEIESLVEKIILDIQFKYKLLSNAEINSILMNSKILSRNQLIDLKSKLQSKSIDMLFTYESNHSLYLFNKTELKDLLGESEIVKDSAKGANLTYIEEFQSRIKFVMELNKCKEAISDYCNSFEFANLSTDINQMYNHDIDAIRSLEEHLDKIKEMNINESYDEAKNVFTKTIEQYKAGLPLDGVNGSYHPISKIVSALESVKDKVQSAHQKQMMLCAYKSNYISTTHNEVTFYASKIEDYIEKEKSKSAISFLSFPPFSIVTNTCLAREEVLLNQIKQLVSSADEIVAMQPKSTKLIEKSDLMLEIKTSMDKLIADYVDNCPKSFFKSNNSFVSMIEQARKELKENFMKDSASTITLRKINHQALLKRTNQHKDILNTNVPMSIKVNEHDVQFKHAP